MKPVTEEDLRRVKHGACVLTACMVRTLERHHPEFQADFLESVDEAYKHFKYDFDGDPTHIQEMLSWTTEMLTGWSRVTGQEKPFLKD